MEITLKYELDFVAFIKQKPELSALDDEFVSSHLKKIYSSLGSFDLEKYSSFQQCLRSKKVKELVSMVRKDLRTVFGLFIVHPLSKRIINSLNSFHDSVVDNILSSHRSTQERLPFYSSMYPLLFDALKDFGLSDNFSVLDIACGYNPFAYKFLPIKPAQYIACDLSSSEMSLINDFFSKTKISGSAFGADALSEQFFSWLKSNSFDVCFLFKALDSFEQVKRHASKKLLSMINAKYFIVSFSLVSIGGGAQIRADKRNWFERFCEQNSWTFKTLQVPNEIFYVIKA